MIDWSSINYINVAKMLVVIIIVIVATTNKPSNYQVMNGTVVKSVSFIVIVFVLYYDIHLGLLLLTLFIIILLQINHGVIEETQIKIEAFKTMGPCSLNEEECDYGQKQKEEISQSHLDYIIDDKVKPYEVFVKMMTNQEHLDLASNSAILT